MAFKFNALSGKFDIVDGAGISQATADTRYLKLSGGTMTGDININGTGQLMALGNGALGDHVYITFNSGRGMVGYNGTNAEMYIGGMGGKGFSLGANATNPGDNRTFIMNGSAPYNIAMGGGNAGSAQVRIYNGAANQPSLDVRGHASQSTTIFQVADSSGTQYIGVDSSGKLTTGSNRNLSLVPNGTGYTIIGDAGTTSHTFNTNDDLLVSGRLEVDGTTYLDSTVIIASNANGIPLTLNYAGNDSSGFWLSVKDSAIDSQPAFKIILRTSGAQKAFQFSNGSDNAGWASFEFNTGGTGKAGLALGAGGSTARDVTLYRDSANVLKTDDTFSALAFQVGATAGVDGTFTTADAKTVTVTKGIITSIV